MFCNDGTTDNNDVSNTHARMTITSSGNVGIGTASPETTLQLHKEVGDDTLKSAAEIKFSTNNSANTTWDVGSIRGAVTLNAGGSSNYPGGLVFATKSPGGAGDDLTDKMVIDANGNVGIGTTTPDQKLDVNGYIKQNNTYFFVTDTTTTFTSARSFGNVEKIDRGGNWSTTTKRFTAPVKGLYIFTFNGFTVTDQHYGLGYNSDNPDTGNYQTVQLWSINGGTGGSHSWMLELNANDFIVLRLYNSGDLITNRCYFMGGLLYAV